MAYEDDYQNQNIFGGLSISSLDSANDGGASDEDVSTQTELYQRLQDLDDIALGFLNTRPTLLNSSYSSYADVEPGKSQEFKLVLPTLTQHDVLAVSVTCLDDSMHKTVNIEQGPPYINDPIRRASSASLHDIFISLFQLHRTMDHNCTISPLKNDHIHEIKSNYGRGSSDSTGISGMFDATFTTADGIAPGTYFIKLTNMCVVFPQSEPVPSQHIRIRYQVHPCVRAIPIETGEALIGSVALNKFVFFRYTLQDPSMLLSIRVSPVADAMGNACDPDLYVTNRHNGLVAVDRTTAQWSSTQSGCDRVDIHPQDAKAALGSTFILGVVGYREMNHFELCVQVCVPNPIQEYSVGDNIPVTLSPGDFTFFAMKVDSTISGRITMCLHSSGCTARSKLEAFGEEEGNHINTNVGRGVYGCDLLDSIGRWLPSASRSPSIFPVRDPPSPVSGTFPILYLSAYSMYPKEDNYTWRISNGQHNATTSCVIETDDWRYTSNVCYFSIYGALPDTLEKFSHSLCTLSSHFRPESDDLSIAERERLVLFQQIFECIDGPLASQTDRTREGLAALSERGLGCSGTINIDDQALTYGEITYVGFVKLLAFLQSLDGDGTGETHRKANLSSRAVLYDLGCGSGKVLIAAALSGSFRRCIGVEILPSLCACAENAVERFRTSTGIVADACDISVVHADAINMVVNDADIIFLSSLCFPDTTMAAILERCTKVRPGALLCTLKLPPGWEDYFHNVGMVWVKMTWAKMSLHVLRRRESSS